MNHYEGMFIFPDSVREEAFDEVAARVRAEVERLGGKVETFTRLGQRAFARPLGKLKAGHYAVSRFELDGDRIPALRERLKLGGEVFRAQFLRVPAGAQEKAEPDALAQ